MTSPHLFFWTPLLQEVHISDGVGMCFRLRGDFPVIQDFEVECFELLLFVSESRQLQFSPMTIHARIVFLPSAQSKLFPVTQLYTLLQPFLFYLDNSLLTSLLCGRHLIFHFTLNTLLYVQRGIFVGSPEMQGPIICQRYLLFSFIYMPFLMNIYCCGYSFHPLQVLSVSSSCILFIQSLFVSDKCCGC